ncbi:MAG: RraA family protein [Verrucomicrobia bacterium]|nr:RraA family protein [Verrucomicrobiota bacterium]
MTSIPDNDTDLFALLQQRLYTPVICDVLDGLGEYHRFLPAEVRPMLPEMKIAGLAMPVLMMDVYGEQAQPFGKLTEALDQLRPGEIYVASGGGMRCAYWGELLTATARTRGAAGDPVTGAGLSGQIRGLLHGGGFSAGRLALCVGLLALAG